MKYISHVIACLKPITIALFFGAPALFAQGWQDLPNTKLQSVCPPDNFQPAGGGMPAYAFSGLCYGKITDYSSAVADTKRNRLIILGGGHGGYRGNEIYSLDLVNKSPSTATCGGLPCVTSTNTSAPTMTRLNDPSIWKSDCSNNADGSLQAEHTWGAPVYLPKHDKVFTWLGVGICTNVDLQGWLLDMSTMKWTNLGVPPTIGSNYTSGSGASCALDPTTDHETVVCIAINKYLVRYDADTNTWSPLVPFGSLTTSSGGVQTGPSLVVDPDRKLLFSIGSSYQGPLAADPHIYAINLGSGKYEATDWTSSVSGCGDLMGYAYPSVVWDPSIHKIVGYVPRTVASTSANNRVFIFDPATKTCVTQPLSGGPAANQALLNTMDNTEQGMFGRFTYFPALGKYVLVNNEATNAATFTLNVTPTNGLGSSTLTCVDRDGDHYGTGPGCAGPDADDLDATVRTGPEFLAKWSTMTAGLQHLGYSPARIWYISTTGSDATGAVNDVTRPFATCCGAGKANPAPGDVVMLRGGTYTFFAYTVPTGTEGHPIVYMSYPGELAYFGSPSSGFNFLNTSNVVLDGMKIFATNTACVNIGIVSNMAVRHVEASGCEWGIDTELPIDFTIEDSVLHDAFPGGGQHGIYLTNHSLTTIARDVFVRRNLLYNNPYTGFQFNGKVNNLVVEQNISYNNDTAGFSWLTGVSKSIFRSNVSINNEQGLVLYQYQAFCDVYDPNGCPYGENNNLIENFTSYSTGTDRYGVPFAAGFAAITVGDDSTRKADMGHNIYRNINVVNYHVNGYGLGPFNAADASLGYFSTSTFDHVNVYNSFTPPGAATFSVGTNYYTCAQAASTPSVFGSVTNCSNADPMFVAASTSFFNTPASFDLRLQSSSPAVHTGTSVAAPAYDVIGNPYANPPSMGAYEFMSTVPGSPSPCDLNRDGVVNGLDVQVSQDQVLGVSACGSADLQQNGQCNVVDVQRVIVAAMGGSCVVGN